MSKAHRETGICSRKREKKTATTQKAGRHTSRCAEPEPRNVEHAPLPNIKFKDKAPLLVTILGNVELIQQLSGAQSQGITFKLGNRAVSLRIATNINSYIDFSKISDLVIFGSLDMETFEFLSLMNVHGFTKFCFFTQLSPSAVKKRVWKEVSVRVHVFNNIDQLVRYICRIKVRPLELKSKNPFLFVERVVGDCLCGYVRGGPMDNKYVYVPGVGCSKILEIKKAADPLCKRGTVEPEMVDEPSEDTLCISGDKGYSNNGTNSGSVGYADVSSGNRSSHDSESSSAADGSIQTQEKELGLTREDLVRKYEKKTRKAVDAIKMQRLMFEKDAENCSSDFVPGTYVRIRVSQGIDEMKSEFRSSGYLIVGTVAEGDRELVRGKVKAHKWAECTVNSYEPAIISLGWYRFQSIPILSVNDGRRNRYLKKNLDGYCDMTFFGPPRCTGRFCLIKRNGFRILALGSIEGQGGHVVKKCKLVGSSFRVFQNSVFIRNMFNTRDEVRNFIGGKLKSVSGLRGIIKKPMGYNGDFRASFEGSLNRNDVVFLKCYFPTDVPRAYSEYRGEVNDIEYSANIGDGGMRECGTEVQPLLQAAGSGYTRDACMTRHSISEPDGEKSAGPRREQAFSLPTWIESKLPLDKREIVEKDISIPDAPEEKEFRRLKDQVAQFRRKKALVEEQVRANEDRRKHEARKQKEAGKCRSIIKSVVDMKKKHKRRRRP